VGYGVPQRKPLTRITCHTSAKACRSISRFISAFAAPPQWLRARQVYPIMILHRPHFSITTSNQFVVHSLHRLPYFSGH